MTQVTTFKIGASEVDELILLINDYSGYDFSDYSMPSLHRRFQRYIDLNKISDFKQLLQDLMNDSAMINNLIEAFAQDENLKVLDISNILFKENDFTSEIEPSEIGGEKLANQIALISI